MDLVLAYVNHSLNTQVLLRVTMSRLSAQESNDLRKARRADGNTSLRLCKTVYRKLENLCKKCNAKVYCVVQRNGRYRGFVSLDETGRPWSPPTREALVRKERHMSSYET
jgi:hypothetical protein